jgi:hypothetical protein
LIGLILSFGIPVLLYVPIVYNKYVVAYIKKRKKRINYVFICRFLTQRGLNVESFTSVVIRDLAMLEDPKPGAVARVLLPLLNISPGSLPKLHLPVSTLVI